MQRKTVILLLSVFGLGGLALLSWTLWGTQGTDGNWVPTEKDMDLPIHPPREGGASLEVVTELSKPAIRVGERLPVRIYLKNSGSSPITVLGSLHNSEFFRYPLCQVQVVDQDGSPQTWQPAVRCGNTNPLNLSDFRDLRPGEHVELHHEMLWAWKPSRPGTYTITYQYDSRGKVLGSWFPFGGPGMSLNSSEEPREILSHLKKVAQGLVKSKPQTIVVEP